MSRKINIGIIICDRYRNCAGGKCFRALKEREGAFSIYDKEDELKIVGYTTCGGCPGGNIEYTPEEMRKNGVDAIHLATGFLVGYPPCPYTKQFKDFIEEKYDIKTVVGTHPIPEKYFQTHSALGTWDSEEWKKLIEPTLTNEETRLAYN
ncbi:MAG: CGGC domain-containing protein [Chlorobi bacterium]|nr:CGGC domain-containing protein [Chlorobiota bacterium]